MHARKHVVDLHVHEPVARGPQRADDTVGLDRDAMPQVDGDPERVGCAELVAQGQGVGDGLDEHPRFGLEAQGDA